MNTKRIAFFLSLLFCMTLALGCMPLAHAEDCFTLNVDTLDMDSLNNNAYVAEHLSAQTQGIRIQKYISDSSEQAAPVRLTLMQMDDNTLLFDKDYGYQSGTFDSNVIYLPYVDDRTIPYLVTLYVADYVYAMPFMHLQSRLTYNMACSYGVRLRDLNAGLTSDWLMGTMVDLDALRAQGSMVVDVCASNRYLIGQATIAMQGDQLSVALAFLTSANVEVNYISLYVITNCASFTTADIQRITQPALSIGQWTDVSGASSALIYMPMQVSYDPAGLAQFGYDLNSADLSYQMSLWTQNVNGTTVPSTDDAYWNENAGWDENADWNGNSGWDDNAGWDDNSGWDDGNQDSFVIEPGGW